MLPIGSTIRATPNPFNYGGDFLVADTGGAIKGNRIDFYDWRGRREQLAWGRRAVNVELVQRGSGAIPADFKLTIPGVGGIDVPLPGPDIGVNPGKLLPDLAGVVNSLQQIATAIAAASIGWIKLELKLFQTQTWIDIGKIFLGFFLLRAGLKRMFEISIG